MIRAAFLAGVLVAAISIPAHCDDAQHAFVEVDVARDTYFVQEPIHLTLRIGVDRPWFADHVVSRFRRTMDVPIVVLGSWLDALPGEVPLAAPQEVNAPDLTLALGEDVVAAHVAGERTLDGRTFTLLEIDRDVLLSQPGDLVLPPAVVRFTVADSFDDDALGGRVARDAHDVLIRSAPRSLRILPLPEAGRPPEFGGAVGRFAVRSVADRTEAKVGESLKLTLEIAGDGNLATIEPPRLAELRGFHVLGVLDQRAKGRRTFVYDVAPADVVSEIPAIGFRFFDPQAARYEVVATSPIPLTVHAGAARPSPVDPSARESGSAPIVVGAIVLALLSIAAMTLVAWRRSRARAADVPDAAAAFRRRCADSGTGVGNAFVEYLAARLGCSPAAVVSPDLAQRLVAAGIPGDLAARVSRTVETLVAARFGGAVGEFDESVARALVDEIENSRI